MPHCDSVVRMLIQELTWTKQQNPSHGQDKSYRSGDTSLDYGNLRVHNGIVGPSFPDIGCLFLPLIGN